MNTLILDAEGRKRSEGRNLAIMFRYAKTCKGVKKITVAPLDWNQAAVKVEYINGWLAITKFADLNNACKWAKSRSALGRSSWFCGCEVDLPNR